MNGRETRGGRHGLAKCFATARLDMSRRDVPKVGYADA